MKAVVPSMMERQDGHIVVVSSLVGKFGTPLRSSYAASTHALHGWFDSLRSEVHDDDGIGGTLACPGFLKTNVASIALYPDGTPKEGAEEKGIPPEQCATALADAIERGTAEFTVSG